MKAIHIVLFFILLIVSLNTLAQQTVGWIEKAIITNLGIKIKARIDSGALHSSLHCDCVKKYFKNNQPWVDIKLTTVKGKSVVLSRQIIRSAKIKRHDAQFQRRDVVKIKICLGSIAKEVEVNLVDRSGLNYQLLIGRSFLADDFLIDTGRSFINPPNCN